MSTPEASISFRELLAYTDYLANRWLNYFRLNPGALDVNVGGKAGTIRDLVAHIVFVEGYFACRLLAKDPPAKPEAPSLDDLATIHQAAQIFTSDAPRMDVLGRRAIAATMDRAGLTPPGESDLQRWALAGDLVANSLYYSLVAIGRKEGLWARAVGLGVVAGVEGRTAGLHLPDRVVRHQALPLSIGPSLMPRRRRRRCSDRRHSCPCCQ